MAGIGDIWSDVIVLRIGCTRFQSCFPGWNSIAIEKDAKPSRPYVIIIPAASRRCMTSWRKPTPLAEWLNPRKLHRWLYFYAQILLRMSRRRLSDWWWLYELARI